MCLFRQSTKYHSTPPPTPPFHPQAFCFMYNHLDIQLMPRKRELLFVYIYIYMRANKFPETVCLCNTPGLVIILQNFPSLPNIYSDHGGHSTSGASSSIVLLIKIARVHPLLQCTHTNRCPYGR